MRIFAVDVSPQSMLNVWDGRRRADRTWHGHPRHRQRQKKVEAHNFEIRKQLLEYDDVMNKQREVIYQHRHAVLAGEHIEKMSTT